MKAYFDSNVLVAALKAEHLDHARSLAAVVRVHRGEMAGSTSAHALTEVYSVLTRTPFSVRVYPNEALAMIEQSVLPKFEIVEVSLRGHLTALRVCGDAGWKGGRVHDAVHIQAAVQAGCDLIYTYDVEHFQALTPEWGDRIQNPPRA
jgi:predicted nucleic acid-binding protein